VPGWNPDVFLWIESGVQFGIDLSRIRCLKACYLLNTHINQPDDYRVGSHIKWAKHFDIAFLAQRQFVMRFQRSGVNAFWLPVACDPDIYQDHQIQRIHSLAIIGRQLTSKRREQLEMLQSRIPARFEWHLMEDAAAYYSASKIIWNDAKDKLSRRLFEAMACGAAVLADPANGSGLDELFSDKKHLFYYQSDEDLVEQTTRLLQDDRMREETARTGQQEVLKNHTYENRAMGIESVLFPDLR
jgi:hypothetical protein